MTGRPLLLVAGIGRAGAVAVRLPALRIGLAAVPRAIAGDPPAGAALSLKCGRTPEAPRSQFITCAGAL
ncbi:MAG TPA: hypothetical protein VGI12_15250, partial [Vicinamibacterales bacterium]